MLNVTPEDSAAELRLDKVVLEDVQVEATFRDGRCGKDAFESWTPPSKGEGIGLGTCVRPRSNSPTQMSLNCTPSKSRPEVS